MDVTEYNKLNSLEDQIKETNRELRRISSNLEFITLLIIVSTVIYVSPILWRLIKLLTD